MISPHVALIDLQPQEIRLVAQLFARRTPGTEVQVLHDGRTVLDAVAGFGQDAVDLGRLVELLGPLDDRQAAADRLREGLPVDRVLLHDMASLGELNASITRAGAEQCTQDALLRRAAALVAGHPAVTESPRPTADELGPLLDQLVQQGDGWLVLGAWDGPRCTLTLLAEVRDAEIRTITTLDHLTPERPSREQCRRVIDIVAEHGPVLAALLVDVEDLLPLLGAGTAHLGRLVGGQALHHTGLGPLLS